MYLIKFNELENYIQAQSQYKFVLYGSFGDCKKIFELNFIENIYAICSDEIDYEFYYYSLKNNIKYYQICELSKLERLIIVVCINSNTSESEKNGLLKAITDIDAFVFVAFDSLQIILNGYFKLRNRVYVTNKYLYLLNEKYNYVRNTYSCLKNFNKKYFLELLFNTNFLKITVDENNNMILKDFNSKYINCENGSRVVAYNKDNKNMQNMKTLHVFGDSRMLGVFNEDKFTIPSLLQKLLSNNDCEYNVQDYSLPYRVIERVVSQIKKAELYKNDIVIISTSFNKIKSVNLEYVKLFYLYINEAKEICERKGCRFIFFYLPTCIDMDALSPYYKVLINLSEEFHGVEEEDVKKYIANYKKYKWVIKNLCIRSKIEIYDLSEILNFTNSQNFFVDLVHYGSDMNCILAKAIFNLIDKNSLIDENIMKIKIKNDRNFANNVFLLKHEVDINKYIEYLKKQRKPYMDIGGIVANFNPFTYGHLFLIESAAKKVEWLYVFVVQEDSSLIPYADRMMLAIENTKHIKNLTILPSGKFLASKLTFEEYFYKNNSNLESIDAVDDILFFSKVVAPVLNIRKRFLGTEPYCRVTSEYNKKIKEIYKNTNIEVCEIKRKEIDNIPVSASYIRSLLKNKQFNDIKKLVPQATYNYLKMFTGDN